MSNERERLPREIDELEAFKTKCEQLEANLRQSEERFFKIFHASSNPMAITTVREGRIVDLNEANARFGSFTREELIGHTLAELNLLADPEKIDELRQKLQEEGKIHNLEIAVRTKAGEIRTVLLSLSPMTVNGEPCELGFTVDITEQKKKSDALRQSEEKYRMLVENSLQGLAIIQDFRIVFCNNAYAAMTGYSVEELLSFPDVKALIHADDQAFVFKRYLDRSAVKPAPPHYEHRIIRKDGTERWVQIYASPVEYNGKPATQIVDLDITERKKADESLQKALDWRSAIFEGSRDAVIISDENSKFIDANTMACKLTGYSKEELLNMGAWDLNKDVDPSELDNLRNRIINGEDVLGETQIFTKDGSKIDVEFGHRSVMISGKSYIHSIVRDIRNRKRLEAQFLQAQKMEAIGGLAGGVAHDFNNLLNVINGYSELVLDGLSADDPLRKDLEQISKAGQRAATLTSQLLAFGRKQILQLDIIDLNESVAEISTMLPRLIGEDIELVVTTQPYLGLVKADPGQIHQIIMNLAVNARDAMPQGGKLTIETANANFDEDYIKQYPVTKAGPYVMLAISDNGTGMDATTQAHIFEPFFTTKGKHKGTGLGLSTVYGIIKQCNGFIWVYSEPGKGTSFKIYFPRAEGEKKPVAAESKSEPGFEGSETVLLVEDETDVRTLACRILRERGYRILEAADGMEALHVAEKHLSKIHLVLTDVVMPGMNGKDLVSQLKDSRPGIKALYVSGYTDNAIVHHGILDPDVSFLQKPFTVDALARKVRKVLDSQPHTEPVAASHHRSVPEPAALS